MSANSQSRSVDIPIKKKKNRSFVFNNNIIIIRLTDRTYVKTNLLEYVTTETLDGKIVRGLVYVIFF